MNKLKSIIALLLFLSLVFGVVACTPDEESKAEESKVEESIDADTSDNSEQEESKEYTEVITNGNRETVREYRDGKNDYTVTVTEKDDNGEPKLITIRDYKLEVMVREVKKEYIVQNSSIYIVTSETTFDGGKAINTTDTYEIDGSIDSTILTEYEYSGDEVSKKTITYKIFDQNGDEISRTIEATEYDGKDVKRFTNLRFEVSGGEATLIYKKVDENDGSKVYDKDEMLVLTYEVTGDTSGKATYYRNGEIVMLEEVDGSDRPNVVHTVYDSKNKTLVFKNESGKVTLTEGYIDGKPVTTTDDAIKVYNAYLAIREEFRVYSSALYYEFYSNS